MVRCKLLLAALFVLGSPWLYATTATTNSVPDTPPTAEMAEATTATTEVVTEAALLQYDSSAVRVRSAETALEKYRSDSEYNYDREVSLNPTLWEQFKEWLWSLLERIFPDDPETTSTIWDWIFYTFIGGVLIFLIFRLSGMTFTGAFGRAGRSPAIATELLGEDIHEMDFDRLVDEAAEQQQYRKAVRLLYLRTLKDLSDREYIHWTIDKTNREYVHELAGSDMRRMFEHLTLLFEYIWYGDFPVDKALYEQARTLFNDFRTSLAGQHV